jgi:hypothetical protein
MRNLIAAAALAAMIGVVGLAAARDASARESGADAGTADWGPFAFLVGDWTGDEGGAMGQGAATMSFRSELGGALLVRHHRIEYPPTRKRTGTVEQDLLVIQRDEAGKPSRAVMFDTGGNETHFTIDVSADGKTITLTSDAQPSVTRHRMMWVRGGDAELTFTHLMAPPTSPDDFTPETAGKVHRK